MKFTTPVIGIVALAVAVLTACSSASSNSSGAATGAASGSTLTIADVAPFSGPDAALGPTYLASCYGATAAINNAGGVLGHQLTCKSVDTRGDPADAVPAVNHLFASTPGLPLPIPSPPAQPPPALPV